MIDKCPWERLDQPLLPRHPSGEFFVRQAVVSPPSWWAASDFGACHQWTRGLDVAQTDAYSCPMDHGSMLNMAIFAELIPEYHTSEAYLPFSVYVCPWRSKLHILRICTRSAREDLKNQPGWSEIFGVINIHRYQELPAIFRRLPASLGFDP